MSWVVLRRFFRWFIITVLVDKKVIFNLIYYIKLYKINQIYKYANLKQKSTNINERRDIVKEIRNSDGRLVAIFNRQKRCVEIIIKGCKTEISFKDNDVVVTNKKIG